VVGWGWFVSTCCVTSSCCARRSPFGGGGWLVMGSPVLVAHGALRSVVVDGWPWGHQFLLRTALSLRDGPADERGSPVLIAHGATPLLRAAKLLGSEGIAIRRVRETFQSRPHCIGIPWSHIRSRSGLLAPARLLRAESVVRLAAGRWCATTPSRPTSGARASGLRLRRERALLTPAPLGPQELTRRASTPDAAGDAGARWHHWPRPRPSTILDRSARERQILND
jgi:hypothetical protein